MNHTYYILESFGEIQDDLKINDFYIERMDFIRDPCSGIPQRMKVHIPNDPSISPYKAADFIATLVSLITGRPVRAVKESHRWDGVPHERGYDDKSTVRYHPYLTYSCLDGDLQRKSDIVGQYLSHRSILKAKQKQEKEFSACFRSGIRLYRDALFVLQHSPELAYAALVFSIETLSKIFLEDIVISIKDHNFYKSFKKMCKKHQVSEEFQEEFEEKFFKAEKNKLRAQKKFVCLMRDNLSSNFFDNPPYAINLYFIREISIQKKSGDIIFPVCKKSGRPAKWIGSKEHPLNKIEDNLEYYLKEIYAQRSTIVHKGDQNISYGFPQVHLNGEVPEDISHISIQEYMIEEDSITKHMKVPTLFWLERAVNHVIIALLEKELDGANQIPPHTSQM